MNHKTIQIRDGVLSVGQPFYWQDKDGLHETHCLRILAVVGGVPAILAGDTVVGTHAAFLQALTCLEDYRRGLKVVVLLGRAMMVRDEAELARVEAEIARVKGQ